MDYSPHPRLALRAIGCADVRYGILPSQSGSPLCGVRNDDKGMVKTGEDKLMATRFETFDGGCDCRFIRYRLTRTPLFVHCCHCRWCQRETGSAFVLNALIETDRVELLHGAPKMVMTPSASGKGQNIARCPRCQIALWSHYPGAGPLFAFVRVGTLDDPDRFPPDVHIFTMSRQPWVTLPGDVPVMREYYDREKCWPKESLERRTALLAKST